MSPADALGEQPPSADRARTLLDGASVVLVAGPGGVGKTTLAASLAATAARHLGRRTLLVTVDPARRLADALGVSRLPAEPVIVPVGAGSGRLFALMVDMSAGWDSLVGRFAEGDERDALLANPLYRSLTTRFVQSHDYIALDHLCTLSEDDRYDLVIVDTPPSGHAIDILDAPDKMVEFFDSRLLRWLTAPYRSRLASAGAKPFLALAERLLGGQFLARIAEFFWLFSRLQPGIVARAAEVRTRLDDPGTRYVLVTTGEPGPRDQTADLLAALRQRRREPSVLLHNRAAPLAADADLDTVLGLVDDDGLRSGMAALAGGGADLRAWWAAAGPDDAPLVTVPWRGDPITSVEQLASLLVDPGTRWDDGGPPTAS
ncbi:MAG: ArsA-related P-loop ATPase [Actinomycetota bacterium]